MISELINSVREGNSNPLQVYVQLKRLEKELEAAIKEIAELAISEADKYEGKRFTAFDVEIEKKSAPATYKYDHIPQWFSMSQKIKNLQEMAKKGIDFEGGTLVDEQGEIIPPAIKIDGKSIISIKLKNAPPSTNT